MPEITRLAAQGKYADAYRLAEEAERIAPRDPMLAGLWPEISIRVTIETDPSGAAVAMKEYTDLKGEWLSVGQSPLKDLRIPRGYYRFRLTKAGFSTAEGTGGELGRTMRFLMDAEGAAPPGMVRIPGGPFSVRVPGTGLLGPVELEEYWIDKLEVTNRQFKEFVDQGGYQKRDYWKIPIRKDGNPIEWQEAMAHFRDATGRPGPALWEAGSYPPGEDEFPVTGVSWYEAAAYAEFAEKRLRRSITG
jgi:formylglycine-generating enzyme required for sulfatase activity